MQRVLLAILLGWLAVAAAAPEDDFRAGEQAFRTGDLGRAMPLLKRAADAGNARSQALYGHLLDISEFNEEAALYYRRAAEQGDADGQFGLGTLHVSGEGVERDAGAARRLFELAAAQGHLQAVNTLAQATLAGELGFAAQPRQAAELKWVHKAAEQGFFPALDYLAKGYRSGAFGALDLARADELEARIKALSPPPPVRKGPGKKK